MTTDAQDPPASKNSGQQEARAAARVPIPPELQERITANTEALARAAWKATGGTTSPAQDVIDQITRKNPEIFGSRRLSDLFVEAALGGKGRAAEMRRLGLEPKVPAPRQRMIEAPVVVPSRPEPELLRRLLAQLKETDKHQAAILAIQQAEYERSQRRDADDAARDHRDHRFQKWNLAVSTIAAVAGIVAIVVTIVVAK